MTIAWLTKAKLILGIIICCLTISSTMAIGLKKYADLYIDSRIARVEHKVDLLTGAMEEVVGHKIVDNN